FGPWLKQRRVALDLTQRALAELADCSVWTIRKLEADRLRPSRQLAGRLAPLLSVPESAQDAFVRFARSQLSTVSPGLSGSARLPSVEQLLFAFPPVPVPATTLIGRGAEAEILCELLRHADVRLLTLVGPPGVGKTRLGIHVAAMLAH